MPVKIYFQTKGFTLIELSIVFSITAILIIAIYNVFNPIEFTAQSKDSIRISDVKNIYEYTSAAQEQGLNIGASNIIYISIPDDISSSCSSLGLPTPPAGYTYRCSSTENFRKINGSGWLPVNFSVFNGGTPFAVLPIDPINSTSSGFFYAYTPNGAVSARLASKKFLSTTAKDDGGIDPNKYEIGKNP